MVTNRVTLCLFFVERGGAFYAKEAGKKSVTVMISDSCPCHHPNTGNKRWCCGDRTHLDLSYAAFDQIAVRHRGVVDLKVRPADCSKQGTVAYYQ